jgi:hypothetical protein
VKLGKNNTLSVLLYVERRVDWWKYKNMSVDGMV